MQIHNFALIIKEERKPKSGKTGKFILEQSNDDAGPGSGWFLFNSQMEWNFQL